MTPEEQVAKDIEGFSQGVEHRRGQLRNNILTIFLRDLIGCLLMCALGSLLIYLSLSHAEWDAVGRTFCAVAGIAFIVVGVLILSLET